MITEKRINKLKQELSKMNLDGMYVTNLTNVRYLTGFTGSAGSVLVLENENHFFTDGRYIEQSKEQIKNCQIHIVGSAHYEAMAQLKLLQSGISIAIEGDAVSVNLFDNIKISLSHVNWEKISDIFGVIAAV